MITKEQARKKIKKLVETFRNNIKQYQLTSYKEARVRTEFIDKLFILLGWDIYNKEGNSEQFKDVISEDSIKIGAKTKAPDYAFRVGGTRIFFVEAKKPAVNIKEKIEPAFQLRRYAWNSKIPISILTDFEELAIYDCRIKPNPKDKASVARINLFNFEQYGDRFDELWNIFSKEAVLKGSFERFIESSKGKKGTSEVDNEFLKEIEKWRDSFAKNIALRNPTLSNSELNYIVQNMIDRILFLRICEDRDIEIYEKLKDIAEKPDIYKNLIIHFKQADDKYNSGIFDFKIDQLSEKIIIDDKILKDIILNLYYPYSPYDFSVLSIEILGRVYEKFLGKTIKLTSSHKAKVEEKPEVRKAGGIYYTPGFVVDYIIKEAVGKLVEGKKPKQIENVKILDPACGSGTFLVRAYSYLLEHHLNFYIKNPKKYKKEIYQVKENQWFLTTEVRKKILLNNIFGVDIDPQAVELTKLSLLLKVLEHETKESVNQQLKLFQERALPNLDKNIRCGNSLVNSSYFTQKTLDSSQIDELNKINPFDWENEFPFEFDIIIGNPPYVKEDVNREAFEIVKKTDMKKYYQGKMDFWYFFTCKALDLLKDGGLHSYIAQNNWVTSMGASILRNKVLSDSKIISFFDFNDFKVFKEASIQTMVFVLEKKKANRTYSVDYYKVIDKNISKEELTNYLMTKKDGEKIERFKAKINPTELKDKTLAFVNNDVADILNKIQTKGNCFLKNEDIGNGIDVLQDFVSKKHLSKLKDSTIKKGDGIFILNHNELKKFNFNKKELEKIKPYYTSKQLSKYYGNPKNKCWIIYADLDVRSNIKEYPNIKNHLDKFKKVLTSAFKPYGLHRPRKQKFFDGEKIFSLRKTKKVSFTYTNFPCYVSRAFLVIKSKEINQKYLTGLLNSKLVNFWLYHKGKKQGEQLQIDKAPLLKIPLIKEEDGQIIKDVDLLIELNKKLNLVNLEREKEIIKKQIEALKTQIDKKVYKLYKLTPEEIDIIKGFNKKI